jgi:hypothetical protein
MDLGYLESSSRHLSNESVKSLLPNTWFKMQLRACSFLPLWFCLFLPFLIVVSPTCFGQDSTSKWSSAVSGDFNDASLWDTPYSPRNGNGGFSSHAAIIDAAGSAYEVTLGGGAISLSSMELNSDDATLLLRGGVLTITDSLNVTSGDFRIRTGRLNGGSAQGKIIADNDTAFNEIVGTSINGSVDVDVSSRLALNDVSLIGEVNLATSATLGVKNEIRHEGMVNFANGASIEFEDGASIVGTGSGSELRAEDGAIVLAGDFTLNENVTMRSTGEFVWVANAAFTNQGSIVVESGQTTIRQSSVPLFENAGTIQVDSGAILDIGGPLDYEWSNENGVLNLNGGTINFGGTIETANLNQSGFVRNGGTLNLQGVLENTSSTLFTTTSGGSSGQIGLLQLEGGEIVGGNIQGDLKVINDSTRNELDGVSVVGDIDMSGAVATRLEVFNESFHEGVVSLGSGAEFVFQGINNSWTGTGTGSTIDAQSGSVISIGVSSQGIILDNTTVRGQLDIRGGELFLIRKQMDVLSDSSVSTNTLSIDGELVVRSGATLSVESLTNFGLIDIEAGATLSVSDTLFVNDFRQINEGLFSGDGDLRLLGDIRFGSNNELIEFSGPVEFGDDSVSNFWLRDSTSIDQMTFANNLLLDGDLNLIFSSAFQDSLGAGQEYILIDVDGLMTGTFDNFTEGQTVGNFNGNDLFLTYSTSRGNGVALFTAVPEPGGCWFLALLVFLWQRPRKPNVNAIA